jgi:hypothetical protein
MLSESVGYAELKRPNPGAYRTPGPGPGTVFIDGLFKPRALGFPCPKLPDPHPTTGRRPCPSKPPPARSTQPPPLPPINSLPMHVPRPLHASLLIRAPPLIHAEEWSGVQRWVNLVGGVPGATGAARGKHVGELQRAEDERDQIRLEAPPSIRVPPPIHAEEWSGV